MGTQVRNKYVTYVSVCQMLLREISKGGDRTGRGGMVAWGAGAGCDLSPSGCSEKVTFDGGQKEVRFSVWPDWRLSQLPAAWLLTFSRVLLSVVSSVPLVVPGHLYTR